MRSQDDDDRDLAAEYALGALDGEERLLAERRSAGEPAFARAVAAWEARLAPLLATIDAQHVSDHVWAGIERQLNLRPNVLRQRAAQRSRAWHRVAFWRWVSAGALTSAAASLAALVLLAPQMAPARPTYVAMLAGDDGVPAFSATLDSRSGMLVIAPMRSFAGPQPAAELWMIANGGSPVPLAVFERSGVQHVKLRRDMPSDAAEPVTLAVSLEPAGGSPTDKPTGPVVAQGALQRL